MSHRELKVTTRSKVTSRVNDRFEPNGSFGGKFLNMRNWARHILAITLFSIIDTDHLFLIPGIPYSHRWCLANWVHRSWEQCQITLLASLAKLNRIWGYLSSLKHEPIYQRIQFSIRWPKLANSLNWHCSLQELCTQSCITPVMQVRYTCHWDNYSKHGLPIFSHTVWIAYTTAGQKNIKNCQKIKKSKQTHTHTHTDTKQKHVHLLTYYIYLTFSSLMHIQPLGGDRLVHKPSTLHTQRRPASTEAQKIWQIFWSNHWINIRVSLRKASVSNFTHLWPV